MSVVLIDVLGTPLADRIAALASTDPSVTAIGDINLLAAAGGSPGDDPAVDVVLTAPGAGPDRDGSRLGGVDLGGAARLLQALDTLHVRTVLVVSSAMVYGAWPGNPVPLSEDAPLRPNPECTYAMDRAELERLVAEFAREHPSVVCTVLRPTLTIAGDVESVDWLERSLWRDSSVRHGDGPPGQFLLLDDLARAVEYLRRERRSGVYNVAPAGWVSASRQVELTGRPQRGRWPGAIVGIFASLRWRLQSTSTPPEMLPFVRSPWVVASDRLRATGWEATASNDEAYVLGSRPGFWSSLTGRRRQELSLAGLVVLALGAVALVVSAARRRARRPVAIDDRPR